MTFFIQQIGRKKAMDCFIVLLFNEINLFIKLNQNNTICIKKIKVCTKYAFFK